MMIASRFKIFIVLILFLSSCTSTNSTDLAARINRANAVAIPNGFVKKTVRGGQFVFTVFERIKDKNLPYAFYIEKDGYAFTGKGVSSNPTPIKQMLLNLATQDTNRNVVFIARPCQYTDFSLDANCSTNIYWTSKRLADEVVESINKLVMQYGNGKPITLIGHSGGGSLAVLVAARNANVQNIITLAANLDLKAFNEFHHTERSMDGSLSPVNYINKVNSIPQLHLAGAKDETVPPFVIKRFVDLGNQKCIKMQIVNGATHNDGWEKAWQNVLSNLPLNCSN